MLERKRGNEKEMEIDGNILRGDYNFYYISQSPTSITPSTFLILYPLEIEQPFFFLISNEKFSVSFSIYEEL